MVLLGIVVGVNGAGPRSATKKLIEFGWDEPDTAFMRNHSREMDESPFDGCVFHVEYAKPDGGQGAFTWEGWGTRAFTEAELMPALADLKSVKFRRLTKNFLRFNTTPAKLDWFDDYTTITNNARLAGWVARQGKCKGILFDIEQYDGLLFDYRQQRDAKQKSWEVYAAQVRRRGREVMEAFQQGFPNLTVFLTFGYSLPWSESRGGKVPLGNCHYGLLAPFLDGMLEAAKGRARLVDGYELSYGYKDPARFAGAYETMKTGLLSIVANPTKYQRVFSFGFGIWVDNNWRKLGWNAADPAKNFYSPAALEASTRQALLVADEYVWIYSETPRWWSAQGRPLNLPPAYDAALRRAKRETGKAGAQ